MSSQRQGLLQRVSDGFFPAPIVKLLYKQIIPGTTINGYSIVHFITGFIFGFLGVNSWTNAFILHTVWELFQFSMGDNQFTTEDLLFDIPLDTAFFMFGWVFGKKINCACI